MLKIRRFKKTTVNESVLDDVNLSDKNSSGTIATDSYTKYVIREFLEGNTSYADRPEVKEFLKSIWRNGKVPEVLTRIGMPITYEIAQKIRTEYYPGDKQADMEKYVVFISNFAELLKKGYIVTLFIRKFNTKEEFNEKLKKAVDKTLNIDLSSYPGENYLFKVLKYVIKNFDYYKYMSAWASFLFDLQKSGLDENTINIPAGSQRQKFIESLFPELMKDKRYTNAYNIILSVYYKYKDITSYEDSISFIMLCHIFFMINRILQGKIKK